MSEASITIDINKLIDNYQFNEELVKKMYNNDYKQLALDLAKENQKLAIENSIKENIIKEAREYIEMHTPSDIGICGNKTKKYYTLGEDSVDHILEILDKGE